MPQSPRGEGRSTILKIIPVDLNIYMVLQYKALARMSEILENPTEAKEFETEASDLMENIQKVLWDSDSNMFYDKDTGKDVFIKILSLTNFTPIITNFTTIIAKIPSEEQLNSVVELLTDLDEFGTPNP